MTVANEIEVQGPRNRHRDLAGSRRCKLVGTGMGHLPPPCQLAAADQSNFLEDQEHSRAPPARMRWCRRQSGRVTEDNHGWISGWERKTWGKRTPVPPSGKDAPDLDEGTHREAGSQRRAAARSRGGGSEIRRVAAAATGSRREEAFTDLQIGPLVLEQLTCFLQ